MVFPGSFACCWWIERRCVNGHFGQSGSYNRLVVLWNEWIFQGESALSPVATFIKQWYQNVVAERLPWPAESPLHKTFVQRFRAKLTDHRTMSEIYSWGCNIIAAGINFNIHSCVSKLVECIPYNYTSLYAALIKSTQNSC